VLIDQLMKYIFYIMTFFFHFTFGLLHTSSKRIFRRPLQGTQTYMEYVYGNTIAVLCHFAFSGTLTTRFGPSTAHHGTPWSVGATYRPYMVIHCQRSRHVVAGIVWRLIPAQHLLLVLLLLCCCPLLLDLLLLLLFACRARQHVTAAAITA
jgi:hypothetical protein